MQPLWKGNLTLLPSWPWPLGNSVLSLEPTPNHTELVLLQILIPAPMPAFTYSILDCI